MVTSVAQARELSAIVRESGRILAVTYNYTGYPMVKHAAALVRAGALGTIRKVFVEYHQGWLATDLEATGMKQAAWRTDPARAGLGGAIGDIGSHAENLLTTITGLKVEALRAELHSFVAGRKLDDDATVLVRLAGPGTRAHAVLTASQVCIGEKNNLSIRVHGSEGSLTWRQEDPDTLMVAQLDGSVRTLSRGSAELDESAKRATRLPPGHPEGFLEAFANIYRGVAQAIHARRRGAAPDGLAAEFPTVELGARGVAFIEAVVESSRAGGTWVTPAMA
jgi:predicted dehydrogenase